MLWNLQGIVRVIVPGCFRSPCSCTLAQLLPHSTLDLAMSLDLLSHISRNLKNSYMLGCAVLLCEKPVTAMSKSPITQLGR